MLTDFFDRWIMRQKIDLLKGQIAHAQNDVTRHALEEELATEQKTLQETYRQESRPQK